MQSATDRAALSSNLNGQKLGLFVAMAYVCIMPKELMHLVCVFVGATGYLLFLLLQDPSAINMQTKGMPQQTGVGGSARPTSAFQFGTNIAAVSIENNQVPGTNLNKITEAREVTPVSRATELLAQMVDSEGKDGLVESNVAVKASRVGTTDDVQKFSGTTICDGESTDDESTEVSSDENYDSTSDESIVTKTKCLAIINSAPVRENSVKRANLASMETESSKETDSSINMAKAVCCPRFQRKKTVKDNQVGLPAFQQLDKEDGRTGSHATRTRLSPAAAPYRFRNTLPLNAASHAKNIF